MKKIGKKGIMGMALLTSLSLFAGVSIANSTANKTSAANSQGSVTAPNTATGQQSTQNQPNGVCPSPKERKMKTNPDGTEVKKIDPARVEELKKKLNTGKVTKEEAAEIIELIDRRGRGKGRGPRPDGTSSGNNGTGNSTNKSTDKSTGTGIQPTTSSKII